jgi:hypothetical protein
MMAVSDGCREVFLLLLQISHTLISAVLSDTEGIATSKNPPVSSGGRADPCRSGNQEREMGCVHQEVVIDNDEKTLLSRPLPLL